MKHKSGNKTRKRNKINKRSKVSYGKTLKINRILVRSKSNTLTRRNRKKYKTYKTYKIYSGGATPTGSPKTPRTFAGSVTTLTPVVGSSAVSNTMPTLASVAQQLQDYAYNRVSPYHSPGKRVVPVTELPGMGRDARLSHGEKIHSTGDKFTKEEMNRVIKSPLKHVSPPIRKSRVGSRSRSHSRYFAPSVVGVASNVPPPPLQVSPMRVPTPPEILLNSKGKLKTTYTPDNKIIDFEDDKIISTGLEIPHYYLLPGKDKPSEMSVILPLSYINAGPDPVDKLSQKSIIDLNTINIYNRHYSYLSPNIYSVLVSLNLEDRFGTLIVWGKLCDDLIENIKISSIQTIQSRTLFEKENAELFLSRIQNLEFTTLFDMGPSPSNLHARNIGYINQFKIPAAKHPPNPLSLQVIGYNAHPMFRGPLSQKEVDDLLNISEHNPPTNNKENVFVIGHGSMGKELSPEIKFLANKYIRIIELGKKHVLLSAVYPKLFFHINNLLSDPANSVMFNATDKGAEKRKQVFDKLCHYLSLNYISSCLLKDTFNLTDITHDRMIGGHFQDVDIPEDHDVNIATLQNLYSMGIFTPVDYKKNKAKIPIYKKKLFQLYPGTTFFTKNTNIGLVNTLLPIAVQNNKVINVIVFSCSVEYVETDVYVKNPNHGFEKPLETTNAMSILIAGKKFIYHLGRLTTTLMSFFFEEPFMQLTLRPGSDFLYEFKYNDYYFSPTGAPISENIDKITSPLVNYFNGYFTPFINVIGNFNYGAIFSFAGINGATPSYDLIDTNSPLANEPYANELRKVKIYLMDEIYRIFHKTINYYIVAFYNLYDMYNRYINEYNGNTQRDIDKRAVIAENRRMTKDIYEFYAKISHVILFISIGKYGDKVIVPPISPEFLSYPKYIETRKEYDETKVKKLYDEINEGMDYKRYEISNPDEIFLRPPPGRKIRGIIKNPLPPGGFFHTARSTYEYKELPNANEAKERRMQDKHQLYEKQNIRTLARKVRASGDFNISV